MSCVFILCELKILTCFVITKPIVFPCLDSLILVENILKVEIIKKKKRSLNVEELMLLNCAIGEGS